MFKNRKNVIPLFLLILVVIVVVTVFFLVPGSLDFLSRISETGVPKNPFKYNSEIEVIKLTDQQIGDLSVFDIGPVPAQFLGFAKYSSYKSNRIYRLSQNLDALYTLILQTNESLQPDIGEYLKTAQTKVSTDSKVKKDIKQAADDEITNLARMLVFLKKYDDIRLETAVDEYSLAELKFGKMTVLMNAVDSAEKYYGRYGKTGIFDELLYRIVCDLTALNEGDKQFALSNIYYIQATATELEKGVHALKEKKTLPDNVSTFLERYPEYYKNQFKLIVPDQKPQNYEKFIKLAYESLYIPSYAFSRYNDVPRGNFDKQTFDEKLKNIKELMQSDANKKDFQVQILTINFINLLNGVNAYSNNPDKEALKSILDSVYGGATSALKMPPVPKTVLKIQEDLGKYKFSAYQDYINSDKNSFIRYIVDGVIFSIDKNFSTGQNIDDNARDYVLSKGLPGIADLDGKYSVLWSLNGLQLPTSINVDGSVITGVSENAVNETNGSMSTRIDFAGNITGESKAAGTVLGTMHLETKADSVLWKISGNFTGSFEDSVFKIYLNLNMQTVECKTSNVQLRQLCLSPTLAQNLVLQR